MRKFFPIALFGLLIAAAACNNAGSIKTDRGNQITIHVSNGGEKAKWGETVKFSVLTYVKDSLVQSTWRDRGGPIEIQLPDSSMLKDRVPAVFDAITYMAKGDSATVIQPVDTLLAKAIPKSFGEVKEIRYEVVLVDIITKEVLDQRAAEEQKKMMEMQANMPKIQAREPEIEAIVKKHLADYKSGALGANLKKTASGLEYVVISQGSGAAIKDGDEVPTLYHGVLKKDGKKFDSAFSRGMAPPFVVGQLVPGFNEGMKLLNRGGKAVLFIPSALGYGEQENGPIPANSDLVFYIEMGE